MTINILTRAAKGSPLTNDEQDGNIIALRDGILSSSGVKVTGFSQDPTNGDLTITFSDGTSIGPIILPRAPVEPRGEWATGRPYASGDLFTFGGSSYVVAEAHVSTTFGGDQAAGRFVLLAAKGENSDFADAPVDGTPYGRQNSDWTPVVAPAPADGGSYVQAGGEWSQILPNAPSDGSLYGQKDGVWTVVTTNGISHPAPDGKFRASKDGAWAEFVPGIAHGESDGKLRGSKNGAWVEIPASGGGGTGNMRERGEWSASTSYEKNDLVIRNGLGWLARETYFTSAPAPAFSEGGYWIPFGFPTSDITESLTPRILHQFSTAGRSDKKSVWEILNEFETRLKALE